MRVLLPPLLLALLATMCTAARMSMSARQAQFAQVHSAVRSTADSIVNALRESAAAGTAEHTRAVRGVVQQRDHILDAFSPRSFLELHERHNGDEFKGHAFVKNQMSTMMDQMEKHYSLVEAAEAEHGLDVFNKVQTLWESFRKLMLTVREFLFHLADHVHVGVGAKGYVGWKGADKSGVGPNLQLCFDASDMVNDYLYGDGGFVESKHILVENTVEGESSILPGEPGGDCLKGMVGTCGKPSDCWKVIKRPEQLRPFCAGDTGENVCCPIREGHEPSPTSSNGPSLVQLSEQTSSFNLEGGLPPMEDRHEKSGSPKSLNNVLNESAAAIGLSSSTYTRDFWDGLLGSIRGSLRQAVHTVAPGVGAVLGVDADVIENELDHVANATAMGSVGIGKVSVWCGKRAGFKTKMCVNIAWMFPQPKPTPVLTLSVNRDFVNCFIHGMFELVLAQCKEHWPGMVENLSIFAGDMVGAFKGMKAFFQQAPKKVTNKVYEDKQKTSPSSPLLIDLPGPHVDDWIPPEELKILTQAEQEAIHTYDIRNACESSFYYTYSLLPLGHIKGVRFDLNRCLHAIENSKNVIKLKNMLAAGTNAFRSMLKRLPDEQEEQARVLEDDQDDDSSILANSFDADVCSKAVIETEMTASLGLGAIFKTAAELAFISHAKRNSEHSGMVADIVDEEAAKRWEKKTKDTLQSSFRRNPRSREQARKQEEKSKQDRRRRRLLGIGDKLVGRLPSGIGLGMLLSTGPILHAAPCFESAVKGFVRNLFNAVSQGSCTTECMTDADCHGKGICMSPPKSLLTGDSANKRCMGCKGVGSSCRLNSDCQGLMVCNGMNFGGVREGKCLKQRAHGETCTADEQCASRDCDGHLFGVTVGSCDK